MTVTIGSLLPADRPAVGMVSGDAIPEQQKRHSICAGERFWVPKLE
jgi:hypothetical protein